LHTNWDIWTRGVDLPFLDHKAELLKPAVNAEKRGDMSIDDFVGGGLKQRVGINPSLG
jgi:hypothetical protein